MSEQVWLRDASLFARPNTRIPKRWHFARADNPAWSVCGRLPLAATSGVAPSEVPSNGQCQGPGCRQRWAAFMIERREAQTRRTDQ